MSLNKYNAIVMALILSGLVHGIVLFYKQDDAGDAVSDQAASVTVQVELVASASQASNALEIDAQTTEEVVTVEQSAVAKRHKELIRQEVSSVMNEAQVVNEAEIVADYSDVQKSQQHQDAGKRAKQLRKYVYEAINREKHYPYIARKQRREGLVKLDFVMHPDGQVTDVLIIQSSRYTVLDKAAKQAVEAISPFHLAAKYLESQHHYIVGIDFRLN